MKHAIYSLFELSPVPMWVFEVATLRFLDVNVAATTTYGYSKDEFLSMGINDIRPVEYAPLVEDIVRSNSRTGIFFKDVFRHLTKQGELMFVQITSNAIQYHDTEARLVLAINVTENFRAQQMLIENERRFKALVQDGSDLITIIDKDFRYQYVSPASIRLFGVEPDFFIGKKAFDFIHAEDLDRVEREALEIWAKRTIQLSPYRYKSANGNWLWMETTATNLFEDPAVEGIVCTSKEITERIRAEQMVAQNIERFNIVSKATSDVIWDCDLINEELLWNKAIKGILHHRDAEQTSLEWWKQRIHPDDRERVLEKLNDCLENGTIRWTDEYRFLGGDGSYKDIFDRGFVMLDDKGKAYRMIGSMQDITDRKHEEEWSKLLESVVVDTSDGVLITDASGPKPVIIYVNQAMVDMSGYSREELIGSLPDILHAHNNDQEELHKLELAIATGTQTRVELINYTKDGNEFYVSVSLTPIFDRNGALVRWISIQRDVSEERRYVEQIKEKNRKLQDISWLQSHVVRTPLARVLSLLELLENTEMNAEQLELLAHMRNSADELDTIVKQIANNT
ncbi:MAG: PAS domain S-box protein [Pedobacter sp.]|nr:MAG: PAS domain S-box protein [Pedobacter sp.]